MRRLLIFAALLLVAVTAVVSGCGGTTTNTVYKPPVLKPPANVGDGQIPVDVGYRKRKCVHYSYVIDEQTGRRHRVPCPTTPGPAPDPNPQPGPPNKPPPVTPVPIPPGPYTPASGCGVERWSIKTLTDPGANSVATAPKDTTIAALASLAPPVQPTDRVAPVETTTFRLHATLYEAKGEGDSDLHLLLRDGRGNQMGVEATNPDCAAGSLVLSQIRSVRSVIERKIGNPGKYPSPPWRGSLAVTVTGVGFFDRLHGQSGVAPNGIELHPITAIQFG